MDSIAASSTHNITESSKVNPVIIWASEAELANLSQKDMGEFEQDSVEQLVISLNKQAMHHLNNEKIHGYGVVDENEFEYHMEKIKKPDLVKKFR